MRIIARLDIKTENLIKPIQLEGLRIVGNPNEYAKKYYEQGIDELILIDTVATLYVRNHLSKIIKET
jgi:cyclase